MVDSFKNHCVSMQLRLLRGVFDEKAQKKFPQKAVQSAQNGICIPSEVKISLFCD
jgi:hypothetical protein